MVLQIGSVGSSYAAGPGIPNIIDAAASRSDHNYAHLVASHFNANLTDVSVSGATLDGVLSSQIGQLPTNLDAVFVLGGGNDLDYIPGLLQDSASSSKSRRRSSPRIASDEYWSRAAIPDQSQIFSQSTKRSTQQDVSNNLGKIADQLHTSSPKAKVFFVEYITLLSKDTKPNTNYMPLDQTLITKYEQIYQELSSAYKVAAASRSFVTLIESSQFSASHALGSAVPWVNGYEEKVAQYHPKLAGMQGVANQIIPYLS